MGSAQSARGIQLGGSGSAARRSLEDPSRPPAPLAGVAGVAGGPPAGAWAVPPPGAFPPRRCAATGSGSAWKGSGAKVARGRTAASFTAPPRPDFAASPGAAEAKSLSAPSPPRPGPPPSKGAVASGRVPLSHGGTGPPRPRRDCRPGRTVLSAPQPRRAASGRGSAHVRSRYRSGARGRRRCRLPTRPVLKHGPRSLTHARVRGWSRNPAAQ